MNFKSVWEVIKKIGSWVFSKVERPIIIFLTIALLVTYCNYRDASRQYENTISMQKDSITLYTNKVGELYAKNNAYITDIENLKAANEDLYREYKKLKEHPLVITKTEVQFKVDSIYIKGDTTYIVKENEYVTPIAYTDDWFSIKGKSIFNTETTTGSFFIDNINANTDIYVDFITENNNLKIITKANNPYIRINNTEGVMLSPEQNKLLRKRFEKPWALVIGVGPSLTVMDNKIQVYPSLQLTLGYKLISF